MSAVILPFFKPRLDAVMSLHSQVPASAITADLLGTSRESHAVQVTADGLMLTVAYSVMEAETVWLRNRQGKTAEALVLALDYDSGLALLKPTLELGNCFLETLPVSALKEGDELHILSSDHAKAQPASLFAIDEFAGRWEYLLEQAIYTLPFNEAWSGAALITGQGKLCGLGSLALGLKNQAGKTVPGNLFIPTDTVMPHLDYMMEHGRPPGKIRPWLGLMVEEHEAYLYITGIYNGGPAAWAGLEPGDIILSVEGQPVATLAGLFRSVWRSASAGDPIPLTLLRNEETREVVIRSTDRQSFFLKHAAAHQLC